MFLEVKAKSSLKISFSFQFISQFKTFFQVLKRCSFFEKKTAACHTGRSQKSAKKYHLLFKWPHYPHYTQEHLIL